MPDRTIMRSMRLMLAGWCAGMRDIVDGASGLLAYEHYLAHLSAHHPGMPPMSREAFFRADMSARWDGVRRCC
ncbi:MAG: CstA-like transporter-associated (seleno)protein [Steroidobacteraceae bacterium]